MAIGLGLIVTGAQADVRNPYAYRWEVTPENDFADGAILKRFFPEWQTCQDAAKTTRDNADCFTAEFERQDQVLNRTWHETLARWPVRRRPGLIAAQRAWVARRDQFCRNDANHYRGGTIAPVIYMSCRVEVTIRRTIWLEKLR